MVYIFDVNTSDGVYFLSKFMYMLYIFNVNTYKSTVASDFLLSSDDEVVMTK